MSIVAHRLFQFRCDFYTILYIYINIRNAYKIWCSIFKLYFPFVFRVEHRLKLIEWVFALTALARAHALNTHHHMSISSLKQPFIETFNKFSKLVFCLLHFSLPFVFYIYIYIQCIICHCTDRFQLLFFIYKYIVWVRHKESNQHADNWTFKMLN